MTTEATAAARSNPLAETPLILGHPTDRELNQALLSPIFDPYANWKKAVGLAAAGTGLLAIGVAVTIARGIGMWGNNIPVGWGYGIINFVWWIGIGHAGTLISAILLLFQQKWRTSINRFAEAMTIFAVMQAGLFPLIHTGRPWFAIYWLFPYPNTMGIWPNFKSPLIWDVFAVSTYFTISLLFWYIGLVPDLASLRDSAKSKLQRIAYGIFALGWKGSSRHWQHYRIGYLILAALSTPLVLSVHSIVSFDFAVAQLPGWHTTIFPPYFVAGAVFSGFAMVLTLMVPARKVLHFENVVTLRHLENMAKVMLVTGLIVAYGYGMENFMAWYSGSTYEAFLFFKTRTTGPYAPIYWTMLFCNVLVPQTFWFKRMRTNLAWLWIASILVNVGMWSERFVIIVISLHRDFLPSSWGIYAPTWVDWSIYVGTISFFSLLFLLFLRFVPSVAVAEVKELNHELSHEAQAGGHA
ncbi:MAG TPA: NrfD/PsrC family molybdoenzyme membrane anchor subunit [Anaeromyxobacteraceae bacterium]|nr:NrfD/PsrC family molybdoenzyme membrane anchor subunit [Anaeromyxobacteraceae bacterium]